jgi:hypothetical protein
MRLLLDARTNRLKELRPPAPAAIRALAVIRPGELERVGG